MIEITDGLSRSQPYKLCELSKWSTKSFT